MEIIIRKFKESDAREFEEAVLESVEHIAAWLPWCSTEYGIRDAREWARSAARTWDDGTDYRFIIEDKQTGRILGSVGINQIVPQHKIGNLGYWMRQSVLNKGICQRAARLAVEYSFRELDFQRIEIHVHSDNTASNAVAAKLGGQYEGVFRNKLFFRGQSVAAKCYSIIPSDYN